MGRIKPIRKTATPGDHVTTSITLTQGMYEQLENERIRVGARNRSDMVRMILDEYFTQEVED